MAIAWLWTIWKQMLIPNNVESMFSEGMFWYLLPNLPIIRLSGLQISKYPENITSHVGCMVNIYRLVIWKDQKH